MIPSLKEIFPNMGTSPGDRVAIEVFKNGAHVANEMKNAFIWASVGTLKVTFLPASWINATGKAGEFLTGEIVMPLQTARLFVSGALFQLGSDVHIYPMQVVCLAFGLAGLVDICSTCIIRSLNQNPK